MNKFVMNGILWHVIFVPKLSSYLIDRTGKTRLATTDPRTRCIYLSDKLQGDKLNQVLLHELGHVTMFSFDLIDEIHTFTKPEYWLESEEWICNFIADYGLRIFSSASKILGDKAWVYIPYELERLIA